MLKKYFGTDGIRGRVNDEKNKWRNVFQIWFSSWNVF